MPRVLLLATTTGYQTRAFDEAAARLGVELAFATDRCHVLDDPWLDRAIPIRFHDEDASVAAILAAAAARPLDGVVVVGDRPTVIGARVAAALGRPWHPPGAARIARSKRLTRTRLREAGLPGPWFADVPLVPLERAASLAPPFPCVVKPLALSGSRGVMRADTGEELAAALARLRALLDAPDIRAERNPEHDVALVEGFIPGRELALEGIVNDGELHVIALFDKPDPLDGPFFEETIYVTPPAVSDATAAAIERSVGDAIAALGLRHGPVHAECRVNADGVFVLEVAARPIGGLCARALRLCAKGGGEPVSLEEVVLRHALGEPSTAWAREATPSGVMMMPIPRRGIFRRVSGVASAAGVPGVEAVVVTARPDQVLVPLPEGASYLGFIFARSDSAAGVELALRAAHARLDFAIDSEVRVVQSAHG